MDSCPFHIFPLMYWNEIQSSPDWKAAQVAGNNLYRNSTNPIKVHYSYIIYAASNSGITSFYSHVELSDASEDGLPALRWSRYGHSFLQEQTHSTSLLLPLSSKKISKPFSIIKSHIFTSSCISLTICTVTTILRMANNIKNKSAPVTAKINSTAIIIRILARSGIVLLRWSW